MWPDGTRTQGGYADYIRIQGHFAINIPAALKSETACSMLCAGVTVYTPLKYSNVGPGKTVGVVSIGGLGSHAQLLSLENFADFVRACAGHLALQFALALGAEVYAISSSDSKKQDAAKLGLKVRTRSLSV